MKPQPTPQNDLNIGLATIKSTTHGWVAPGGALTLSREVAERWAKVINRRLVNERICKELPTEDFERFEAKCREPGEPNEALLLAQLRRSQKIKVRELLTSGTQSGDN